MLSCQVKQSLGHDSNQVSPHILLLLDRLLSASVHCKGKGKAKVKVKQSRYRPEVAQRVPGS
jgi:hypothetical protein